MALLRRRTPSRFPLVCHPMSLILAMLSLLSNGEPTEERKNLRVLVARVRNRRKNRDLLPWGTRSFLLSANRVKWKSCSARVSGAAGSAR